MNSAATRRSVRPVLRPRNPSEKQCPSNYFWIKSCAFFTLFLWVYILFYLGNKASRESAKTDVNSVESSYLRSAQAMQKAANAAFESAQKAFHEAHQQTLALAEAATKKEKELLAMATRKTKVKLDIEPLWQHDNIQRPGFVVLGMHRSGTSMLSGLLVTGLGYKTGGPLIGPAFDNAKGFFERVDIVLQNDAFMWGQHIDWSNNVISYDPELALQHLKSNQVQMKHGKPGLEFLNDPSNQPWLQKDPRMCITLKTWLALLNSPPAVVFTYRHPLEVAMSLKKRENQFDLERGLRLWIVYNMRAIQNSKGLCVVYSSNDKVLANAKDEVQRISDQLTKKCNVPSPPKNLTQQAVDVFVDPTLRHNTKETSNLEEEKILERHGDCLVPKYESDHEIGSAPYQREEDLYKKAMKVYCDFKSGAAYLEDYIWPELK